MVSSNKKVLSLLYQQKSLIFLATSGIWEYFLIFFFAFWVLRGSREINTVCVCVCVFHK